MSTKPSRDVFIPALTVFFAIARRRVVVASSSVVECANARAMRAGD
jgi:hypothetical protein